MPNPRGLSGEVLAVEGLPSSSCKALSGELYDRLEPGECPFLCCLVGFPYKASDLPLYSKALAERISGTCDSLEEPEGTDVSLNTRKCPALTVLIMGYRGFDFRENPLRSPASEMDRYKPPAG